MKTRRTLLAVAMFAGMSMLACADIVIWSEDFSDVSDWNIIFNSQSDASTITSAGGLGLLYVEAINNEVAYAPNTSFAFDPLNKADYTMDFTVDTITGAVSYDLRLDMFNASSTYLGTVYGVVPQGVFVGSDSVGLGGFTYDPTTAFLSAKVSVFTGPSVTDQTVSFDSLSFRVVPEPSTLALLAVAFAAVAVKRRR